jgi:hypothetical protein
MDGKSMAVGGDQAVLLACRWASINAIDENSGRCDYESCMNSLLGRSKIARLTVYKMILLNESR